MKIIHNGGSHNMNTYHLHTNANRVDQNERERGQITRQPKQTKITWVACARGLKAARRR